MGLFDFFNNDKKNRRNNSLFGSSPKQEKRESWDYGSVSERYFGRDRFGYYYDEESMYSDEERYDRDEL